MATATPIAFYAPMKGPDHPAPSGDRTMARLFLAALRRAGFAPTLASGLRTWDRDGDRAFQERVRREGLAEADRLAQGWRAGAAALRPRLWFTYHVYYKAPDWIGPRVADALGIPYVVAEGSRAMKRADGPWALGHAGAEAALERADLLLALTDADRESLERGKAASQRVLDLPPFVDLDQWPLPPASSPPSGDVVRLLAVAMMRNGDKLASFSLLAEALARIANEPWTLDIVGDGDARAEVERLFAGLAPRVAFHGRVETPRGLAALYGAAGLFVWPAVNEAYGMALLEAQAFGCPVLAGADGGVASVVRDGVTGVLSRPGDAPAFAEALRALIRDGPRRRALGQAARDFVRGERGLDRAAARLGEALRPLMMAATAS